MSNNTDKNKDTDKKSSIFRILNESQEVDADELLRSLQAVIKEKEGEKEGE